MRRCSVAIAVVVFVCLLLLHTVIFVVQSSSIPSTTCLPSASFIEPQFPSISGEIGLARGLQPIFDSLPDFDSQKTNKATVLRNLIHRRHPVNGSNDVVLATHISINKLKVLTIQLKYWGGPASVAVYLRDQAEISRFFDFWQQHNNGLSRTSFHVVIEKNTSRWYPHNVLRNVAMDAAESDYVLLLDVDYIPFPRGCHDRLIHAMQRNPLILERKRTLFILPAFQLLPPVNATHATEEMLPASKAEILGLIKDGKMRPFHVKVSYGGHGPTDFNKWIHKASTQNYNGDFYEISVGTRESNFFEPYVFAYKQGLPRYWEGEMCKSCQSQRCPWIACQPLFRCPRFSRIWEEQDQFVS
eukprot:scaffold4247_cov66-Cylindrotheca_fusiformis.AAC.8